MLKIIINKSMITAAYNTLKNYSKNLLEFANVPLSLDLTFQLVTGDIKFPVQQNIHENSMCKDHAKKIEQYSHLSLMGVLHN